MNFKLSQRILELICFQINNDISIHTNSLLLSSVKVSTLIEKSDHAVITIDITKVGHSLAIIDWDNLLIGLMIITPLKETFTETN